MWELDCEESWALRNWCFWTVVLEKTLESPLDCKEIQPVHSIGDQSWVFFGRNDAKAEAPVLWPPHGKSWLIGKDSDARRDWGQEEKGMTEDEMAGWHQWLDGLEFEWTLGVGDGQGGLACCNSWGRRVGHDWVTELNWTEWLKIVHIYYLQSFMDQESRFGLFGVSAQGITSLHSRCWLGCIFIKRLNWGRSLFYTYSCCWQNSFSCGGMVEGPNFLLVVSWKLSSSFRCQS